MTSEDQIIEFNGRKWPERREAVEQGTLTNQDKYAEYRKTTTIYARKMESEFEVDTLEGLHKGKIGDYIAIGIHGEMYPIDAKVFEDSYEKVEE